MDNSSGTIVQGPIAKKYEAMTATREAALRRARASSALTLPYLYPPEGSTSDTPLPTPYQSVGARGVSNLAAKLLLALLPPNEPFFKLQLDNEIRDALEAADGPISEALSAIEKTATEEIESSRVRVSVFSALRGLLVAGNCLLKMPEGDQEMMVYSLDKYVARRNPAGELMELILKEPLDPKTIDKAVCEACEVNLADGASAKYAVYTYIRRDKGRFAIEQELNGKPVPGSQGFYLADRLPWRALRLHEVSNEPYGRGLVEEYIGDLQSLDGLTESLVKGSAAAAKILFLVHPNSTTRAVDLQKANNGDFVTGNAADVDTLQLNKFADFRVAADMIQRLETRLAQDFMLHQSVQRNAERVTAEEIRFMASELDDALGGVYSMLAQELQLPLITQVMFDLQQKGKLPQLPDKSIRPVIITGLDALGRTSDLMRLDAFLSGLLNVSPEIAAQHVNIGEYISRRAAALRIETKGLIKDDETMQQEQQQAQFQQAFMQLAPKLIELLKTNPQLMQQQAPGGTNG